MILELKKLHGSREPGRWDLESAMLIWVIDTKAKMDQLYDLESLKRGLLVMVKHSEYLSRSPKNKGKQVPDVNLDELKRCIAQIAVFVSEAARSEAVFDYIMRQKEFKPYVRFYINNWKKEQDRFNENKEGYMNDLRIAQLRDKKDTEVIKTLVKKLKVKEEEEAALQFKLSKRAPKKESSSSSTPQRKPVPAVRARRLSVVYSTNSVRHFQKVFNAIGMVAELVLMHSIQNHKYRLVLLIVPTVLSVMAIGSHSLFAKGVKKEHVFFLGFVGLLQGRKSCMVRQPSMKIVVEVPEQRSGGVEEPDTKQFDSSQVDKRESGGHKVVSWVPDVESVAKPPSVMIETSIADLAFSVSQCDSSISFHSAITYVPPPSTVRSVSMRDMGTEMTPIATQEPSKTGTPVRATTPIRNPGSSRPSTPGKAAPASSSVNASDLQVDASKKELSEKELQERTRREIMALGTQLGKMSIAAWASKEEDDKDASTSLKIVAVDQTPKNVIETRAAAWEEAEKAKYTARYKREELKITAWENHQKAKMEAEMRKVEGNLLGYLQVDQSTVTIKRRFPKVVEEELEKAMYAYGYEIVHTLMLDIEPEPDERVKRAMNEIGAASESSAVFIPHGPGAVRDVAAQIREGLLQASSTQ